MSFQYPPKKPWFTFQQPNHWICPQTHLHSILYTHTLTLQIADCSLIMCNIRVTLNEKTLQAFQAGRAQSVRDQSDRAKTGRTRRAFLCIISKTCGLIIKHKRQGQEEGLFLVQHSELSSQWWDVPSPSGSRHKASLPTCPAEKELRKCVFFPHLNLYLLYGTVCCRRQHKLLTQVYCLDWV